MKDENGQVEDFIQQNKLVSWTIQELNPHMNIHTLTLNTLKANITREADDFQKRLRIVAASENLVHLIDKFYNEYSKSEPSPDEGKKNNDKGKPSESHSNHPFNEYNTRKLDYGDTLQRSTADERGKYNIQLTDDEDEGGGYGIRHSDTTKTQPVVEGDDEIIERKIARRSDEYMDNKVGLCVDQTDSEEEEFEDNLEYKINESGSDESEGALEMFEEMDNISIRWLEFPYQAVMKDRVELLKLCAKLGYDMKVFRGEERETLLHVAASKPTVNFEVVEMLLQNIDVDTSGGSDSAIQTGLRNIDISEDERLCLVNLFVKAGADLGANNKTGQTVLHYYVSHLIDHVLADDVALEFSGKEYFSFLTYVKSSHANRDCLDKGTWKKIIDILCVSHINEKDDEGKTPLHDIFESVPEHCLQIENVSTIIDYLIRKGASVTVVNDSKCSILHSAVETYNIYMVKYAIRHGCPLDKQSNTKFNPLYHLCAIEEFSSEEWDNRVLPLLEVLVNAGANLNIKALDSTTPLHHCSQVSNERVCEFLLKNGADVNAEDFICRTPMHAAARNRHANVVEILNKYGGIINVQDKYGYTPLHYAAMYDNDVAVKSLLECGANFSVRCFVNKLSPLHLAAERDDPDIIDILIAAGADVNCVDRYGATPLHYAACEGIADVTEALLRNGADINVVDELGKTPLSVALKMGEIEVSQLLTGDHENEKFDVFHSLTRFPRIPERHIENYFSTVTDALSSIGNAQDISKAILCKPGFMRIDMFPDENKSIHKQTTSLAHAIAVRIGEIDARFNGTVFPCGSVADGCKVGFPNEFDYLVNLNVFENYVENFIPTKTGFTALKIKKDKRCIISEFVDDHDCLEARGLKRYFKELVLEAFYDVQKDRFIQLQCGQALISEMFDISKNVHDLSPIVVVWRGAEFKRLVVYIDINPVIRFNGWPPKAITYSTLLTDLQKHEIYLFPKSPNHYSNLPHKLNLASWCYSFVCVENQIFQELTEVLKDAFTLCKALRKEPLLPYLRRYGDVSNSVSELDINVASTDYTAPSESKISLRNTDGFSAKDDGASDSFKLTDDFDKDMCDNDNVEVVTDNESSVSTTSEESSMSKTASSFSDENNDTVEGEKMISSYHLKQIFLYEVEKIPRDKRNDYNLVQIIPYKVYKKLLDCYKKQMVPSFFFREQNIYDPSLVLSTPMHMLQVRISTNLLTMLEKLGFS